MTAIQALILGILQGATEFLPISSSGHLVLIPWLLGWRDIGESDLAFDAFLHLGTLVAVLAYFWRDLWRIVRAVWVGLWDRRPFGTPDARMGWFILLGSVPAAVVGLLLEDWFEGMFGNPLAVAVLLWGTAALLITAERIGARQRTLTEATWFDAIWAGLGQALAILPGVSRSGATIAAGLTRGLKREEAARFSFLLSIPAVFGAGAIQFLNLLQSGDASGQATTLTVGFVAALLVGLAAIHSLLLFVRRRPLYLFAGYCLLFGGLCMVVYVVRDL